VTGWLLPWGAAEPSWGESAEVIAMTRRWEAASPEAAARRSREQALG